MVLYRYRRRQQAEKSLDVRIRFPGGSDERGGKLRRETQATKRRRLVRHHVETALALLRPLSHRVTDGGKSRPSLLFVLRALLSAREAVHLQKPVQPHCRFGPPACASDIHLRRTDRLNVIERSRVSSERSSNEGQNKEQHDMRVFHLPLESSFSPIACSSAKTA
jgi:hypothetical protein